MSDVDRTPVPLESRILDHDEAAQQPSLQTPQATRDWRQVLETCPKDPKFGYPAEDRAFLHLMLSQHVFTKGFTLQFKDLIRSSATNPRGVRLTSEQEQQLAAALAPQFEAHEAVRQEFLRELEDGYHSAVELGDYVVVETAALETQEDQSSRVHEARQALVHRFGREGRDLFVMVSSLIRPGMKRDNALIYLSRSRFPSTLDLWEEMRRTERSAEEVATRFLAGL